MTKTINPIRAAVLAALTDTHGHILAEPVLEEMTESVAQALRGLSHEGFSSLALLLAEPDPAELEAAEQQKREERARVRAERKAAREGKKRGDASPAKPAEPESPDADLSGTERMAAKASVRHAVNRLLKGEPKDEDADLLDAHHDLVRADMDRRRAKDASVGYLGEYGDDAPESAPPAPAAPAQPSLPGAAPTLPGATISGAVSL